MRTARYAGPSVAQPLDDEIDLGRDLLLQRHRGRARVGRLLVAPRREAALSEPLFEPVEKHIAARLGDVQQPDGQPVKALGPRQPRSYRRTSLRCRIKQYCHSVTSSAGGWGSFSTSSRTVDSTNLASSRVGSITS